MENISVTTELTEPEEITLNWIRAYLGPIGIFGIVCNILIIVTVAKIDSEKTTSGLTLQLLAFWDSLSALADAVFQMTFKSYFDLNVFTLDPTGIICKFLRFFDWLTGHTANWHLVLVFLDKYLSVVYPAFYQGSWNRKHIKTISLLVLVFTMFSQLPLLYFIRTIDGRCVLDAGSISDDVFSAFVYTQLYGLFLAVPGIFNSSMAIRIFFKLRTSRSKTESSISGVSAERERMETAFLRIITSLLLSYYVFVTASAVFTYLGVTEGLIWAHNIGDGTRILQSSINLFLYIGSGPMFREALCNTIFCR